MSRYIKLQSIRANKRAAHSPSNARGDHDDDVPIYSGSGRHLVGDRVRSKVLPVA